jgi:methionine biosynthesis protein MetW
MNTHELFVKNKFKEVSKHITPNSKVLDIGCHNGEFKNYIPSSEYYGIDINKKFILELKKNGVNAAESDLNNDKMPFEDIKFDYVLMLDVLEHVIDPKKLLIKSKTLIQPRGGKLIVTLPNDYHLLNKIRFIFNGHLTEDPFAPYGHLHYFPINSGECFLRNIGFKIEKKVILPPVKPKVIPQFLKNLLAMLFPQAFARDILYILT